MYYTEKKKLLLKCVPETSLSSVFVYDSVINNRDAIRLKNLLRMYLHIDCTLKYMHRVRIYNDTKLYIYYCYGVNYDRGPSWLAVSGTYPLFRVTLLNDFEYVKCSVL
jgi:hypothetical protein